MIPVKILVEGPTDEHVAKRLLKHVGLEAGTVYGKKGKPDLLLRLSGYNAAARFSPWLALVDLDMDAQCVFQIARQWLPDPSTGMRFRIAVRAIEAWLLSDKDKMANFLGVSPSRLQANFERDANPKETLVNIARNSRFRNIRDDLVPRPSSGAKVGPFYVPRIIEFVEKYWRPDIAAVESESLRRCVLALSSLNNWQP